MNTNIEVRELSEINLIGITHIGELESAPKVYERLMKWAFEKGLLNSSNIETLTIYHDNPRITEVSKVRWSACLVVNTKIRPDDEIRNISISKGLYAIGHFEIEPVMFEQAWKSVLQWVKSNGYLFDEREYFEVYHNDNRMHPEHKFIADICIPIIKPKNMKTLNTYIQSYKDQLEKGDIQKAYRELIRYIMNLKTLFTNKYSGTFYIGHFHQGYMDITYFTLTPMSMRNKKLKIGIGFNHEKMQFGIWLGAQNRQIQKEYWEIFKGSDWNKYNISSEINEGFAIVEYTLIEKPDFDNLKSLTEEIEDKAMKFIDEILKAID